MVKIGLQLRANLENIASFEPTVDCVWHLKLQCTSCGEETANWQAVEASNRAPLKKSRGRANLVIKCKLCSRENSVDVLNDELRPYEADKASEFFTVAAFECRGVTPIAFDARAASVPKLK
ncbi:hypothetical protein HPB48_025323 [Haemaphysalis longicornis]|uniref:CXXC motif containing zinc binding protein n=1 Tax=Haemaphysalis longicornis TaxID=44386 RepID=A0A9J6H7E3_HAELO|nr:hypothetical protein HPB48_025323 [Haemaphysalis longicornis]